MTVTIQKTNGKADIYIMGKKWDTLSPQQKSLTALMASLQATAGVAQIVLLILALKDIRRRPAEQINGKKWVWVLISFVEIIGPIAYFRFGRKHLSGE